MAAKAQAMAFRRRVGSGRPGLLPANTAVAHGECPILNREARARRRLGSIPACGTTKQKGRTQCLKGLGLI